MTSRTDLARRVRRVAIVLPPIALVALAQGCVSTEALYAEYDERACRVVIAASPPDAADVEESGAVREMPWEPRVGFAHGSDALAAHEMRRLEHDVAVLRAYPTLRVSIRGFTDASGSSASNRALAARRVERVAAYLDSRGIDRRRLDEEPFGERLPLAGNGTGKRVALDRRVELLLLDADGLPLPLRVPSGVTQGTSEASAPGRVEDAGTQRR